MRGRVLIAVSSIGLGHAARARVYGRLLESSGFSVDYYAPEPAGSYLKAWGLRVHGVSWMVESLSVFLEKHWLRTGRALIGLRQALEEHRAALRASELLASSVDLGSYDLVVADESWEIAVIADRVPTRKVWVADFVGYRARGLGSLPAAIAVNRFLLGVYGRFEYRIYVGLEGADLDWRMTPLGPRASRILRDLFTRVGPLPAVLEREELDPAAAASMLGLEPGAGKVLIMLGGTRAGEDIAAVAAEAAAKLGLEPVIAGGPRARVRAPPGAVNLGYNPRLPVALKAFKCAYSLAGLSSIATLAATGTPAVLHPLPGHFEQEENARIASRTWPGLFVENRSLDPGRVMKALEEACSLEGKPVESLYRNSLKMARLLARIVEEPSTGKA